MWSGFFWLRIGTSVELCIWGYEPWVFIKSRGFLLYLKNDCLLKKHIDPWISSVDWLLVVEG